MNIITKPISSKSILKSNAFDFKDSQRKPLSFGNNRKLIADKIYATKLDLIEVFNNYMQKDKLLILDFNPIFIDKVITKLNRHQKESVNISITGASGAGKTTITNIIGTYFEKKLFKPAIVNGDNYYKSCAKILEKNDLTKNEAFLKNLVSTDKPKFINFKLLTKHIQLLTHFKPVRAPQRIRETLRVKLNQNEINPSYVLIHEGAYTLCDKFCRSLFDIKIYVESGKEAIKRWILRAPIRGKAIDTPIGAKCFKNAIKGEKKYIKPLKNRSDVVLNGKASDQIIISFLDDLTKIITNN